ncbi:MAG: aminoglycoside adenylyltransferase domain-containing protein [Pseudomonadota bacterium]
MLSPTPYAELNEVLAELLTGARSALGTNFVGAYLQGSFAIGDYSEFSDCDFIVVTEKDLSEQELEALRGLHHRLYRLPSPYWPRNIEGSYAPRAILRRWSTEPRDPPGEPRAAQWGDPGMDGAPPRCYPLWYLPHGSDVLVRSEHDNSQVVRWTLRERGVTLAGPTPAELIDPIDPADLKAEVRATLDLALQTGLAMPIAALQTFWVGLCCRILHTIETGRITSKKEAMGWAQATLPAQWQPLIAHALTQKKGDPAQAQAPVAAELAAQTRAFVQTCADLADQGLQRQR